MPMKEPQKYFTVLVVPDRTSRVRKVTIARSSFYGAVAGLVAVVLIVAGVLVHYVRVLGELSDYQSVYQENREVALQLRTYQERIRKLDTRLDHLERIEHKLRVMTSLEDPSRNIAIGPLTDRESPAELDSAFDESANREDTDSISSPASPEGDRREFEFRKIGFRLEKLEGEARARELSLEELHALLDDQRSILNSTPSIWPTRGFVSSTFGYRVSPFTSVKKMHEGLDLAAPKGTDVVAPADGVITFSGVKGAYGNIVVVDHGYGLVTRFGHLSKVLVEPGQQVKRGASIAKVGNTGRSTGDHLHYEVRIDGVPVNPTRYILD